MIPLSVLSFGRYALVSGTKVSRCYFQLLISQRDLHGFSLLEGSRSFVYDNDGAYIRSDFM